MQKGCQLSHYIAFMILEESLFLSLCWVSLAEYILVLRVLLTCCFADGQMYYGYCILCLYLAMGDD
jgi:hypothetical protein